MYMKQMEDHCTCLPWISNEPDYLSSKFTRRNKKYISWKAEKAKKKY